MNRFDFLDREKRYLFFIKFIDRVLDMRLVKSSARAFSGPIRTVLDNGVQVVTQQNNQG